ncbi:hypothetical protein IMZ31_20795 (plasmid) [Pontibacillus sp. ALD_SL1]|uniref:hypothetical protein n=1 Tax=Pontibacillus sp. ALD_SL1 TaxID=2777185 RepID=UPI001A96F367|nr:hypothetical protein [Pontibacillus sp. ALD_SL1]QST02988.1 hypothetical protein IMZ31_20795 [Pontibacillus sp. ALD_SL1]
MELKNSFDTFVQMVQSPNVTKDDAANYVTSSHGYLWKSDPMRLFAVKWDQHNEHAYHYSINDFQNAEEITGYDQKENGDILLFQQENTVILKPKKGIEIPPIIEVLNSDKVPTIAITIKGKELVKFFLMCHRKLNNGYENHNLFTVRMNTKKESLALMKQGDVILERSVPMKSDGTSECSIDWYYGLIKDVFTYANGVNAKVDLFVYQPYYTRFDFGEGLQAVVLHQKETLSLPLNT